MGLRLSDMLLVGAAPRVNVSQYLRAIRAAFSRSPITSSSPNLPFLSPYLFIGFALLTATVLCGARSLVVPPRDLLAPLGLLLMLAGLALYYRRRGEAALVLSLTSLAQIVGFVTSYIVLMYAVATLARPLVDRELAAFDAWCGITVPAVRGWADAHPLCSLLLNFAYDTLLYQTALVLIVLGFKNDRVALERFLVSFMLSAIVSLGLFALFPADGPFVTYGLEPSLDQTRFLDHFRTLRDGTRTLVTFRGAEGLITFPSFHVAWAMVITWSLRYCRRPLFLGVFALNLLVIASTMATGWHYFADVLGGAAVAGASIAVAHRWARRRYTIGLFTLPPKHVRISDCWTGVSRLISTLEVGPGHAAPFTSAGDGGRPRGASCLGRCSAATPGR